MAGQLINRGERTWLVRVFLGRDVLTGKKKYHNKTVKGTKKDAQRYLNGVLRDIENGKFAEPKKISLNKFLEKWLSDAVKPRVRERTYHRVASSFGFEPTFFETNVRQASPVRNMCSHHSRLWNRSLPFPLKKIRWAKFDKSLLTTQRGRANKLYNFLAIVNFIADEISPGHSWTDRLLEFLGQDESRLGGEHSNRSWHTF